jgi:very-short-patch-repair endonuclease
MTWLPKDPTPGELHREPTTIGATMEAWFGTLLGAMEQAERHEREEVGFSIAEVQLAEALMHRKVYFEQQYRVGPYDLDFYFPDDRLCVEVDGSQHLQQQAHDRRRDAYLRERGISTLRITAKATLSRPDACVDLILEELKAKRWRVRVRSEREARERAVLPDERYFEGDPA